LAFIELGRCDRRDFKMAGSLLLDLGQILALIPDTESKFFGK